MIGIFKDTTDKNIGDIKLKVFTFKVKKNDTDKDSYSENNNGLKIKKGMQLKNGIIIDSLNFDDLCYAHSEVKGQKPKTYDNICLYLQSPYGYLCDINEADVMLKGKRWCL